MKYLAYVTAIAAISTGCIAQAGETDGNDELEQDVSTTYVDILDFQATDQLAWYGLIRSLNTQFNDECGDTYCEGDWSNLVPLTFSCSVSSKAGSVRDCAWTFAAAQTEVDPRNAAILVNAPTFQCHIKMKTTAAKLTKFLATAGDKLRDPLPGTSVPTIGEQLSECFNHPIGATPGTLSTAGSLSYVSASEYYTSSAGLDRWYAAKRALVAGFDRVCSDTFCSGDFGDLQAMDFTCAVTKSTGNIKSCAWTFGGSWHLVPESGGLLALTSQTFRCNVPVKGTLSKLLDTLTAPYQWADEVVRRPLPGTTATAYDALLGCLP
jgi:hypothetical protein